MALLMVRAGAGDDFRLKGPAAALSRFRAQAVQSHGDDFVNSTPIVLASRSAARIALLSGAGVPFTVAPSAVDERAVEAPLITGGASPADVAVALAEAKAVDVSATHAGALTIGADQTLDLDGDRWTKPDNIAVAREQIARLSGRTHQLHSAVAIARAGKVTWCHVATASLTMRALSATAIDAYLLAAGDSVTGSVGAYQLEGAGVRLFERIEGDYFTILGLPLLPLLAQLREEGVLPW
jgi:septum formation protein